MTTLLQRHERFRVLVTGARRWRSGMLPLVLADYHRTYCRDLVVIHGDQGNDEEGGIDWQAHRWCEANGVEDWRFPALWDAYRRAGLFWKAAGSARNREMLWMAQPHVVLAFHPDISGSKGTKDMVGLARKALVPVRFFEE